MNGSFIPTDLRMEYVVKERKKHIKNMNSGQTIHNIQVHSKAISGIELIGDKFDEKADVLIRSSAHKHKSDISDVLFIIDDLVDIKLFALAGRSCNSFQSISYNIADDVDKSKLLQWLHVRGRMYANELGN